MFDSYAFIRQTSNSYTLTRHELVVFHGGFCESFVVNPFLPQRRHEEKNIFDGAQYAP